MARPSSERRASTSERPPESLSVLARIRLPRMRLSHHRAGSGEPVLLIHGVGSQWQVWEPVIERVAREREVIAMDMPGFGGSPTLPIGVVPTVSALSDSVASFLDDIGIERAVLGGNSLGGFV